MKKKKDLYYKSNKRFLYFGQGSYGSTSYQRWLILSNVFKNSCLLDSRIVFRDRSIGRSLIDSLSVRLGFGNIFVLAKELLLAECDRFNADVVWVDGGIMLDSSGLIALKKKFPSLYLIHYTPDSLFAPAKNTFKFRHSLVNYDLCVMTKHQDVDLYNHHSKKFILVDQGFDSSLAMQISLQSDRENINCKKVDVLFVGAYMRDRMKTLKSIIDNFPDLNIQIYGTGWDKFYIPSVIREKFHGGIYGEDYYRKIKDSKIVLGFLNNLVGDLVTTRSYEIPSAGSFLLAERTEEHRNLLIEGVEAEYFSSINEINSKIYKYINDGVAREKISENGCRKITSKDLTWKASLVEVLAFLDKENVLV